MKKLNIHFLNLFLPKAKNGVIKKTKTVSYQDNSYLL